jgi:hypothetical protein
VIEASQLLSSQFRGHLLSPARRQPDIHPWIQAEGFQEPEDIAAELTGLNETEAVIDVLEQRRERLAAQLKALG